MKNIKANMLGTFIGTVVLSVTALAAPASNTTPSTTTENPKDITDSAIFFCGNYLHHDALAMLFPPSDQSLRNIVNSTQAKIVHAESYGRFCDKIDTYTACVKLLVNRSHSPIDDLLKHYIDQENFSKAMGLFCSNKTLVTDNFVCTKSQSETHSCPYGGMYGIMAYVSMVVQNGLHKQQYCDDFLSSVRCRVDKQLKPCGTEYAEMMEGVYTKLVQNICKIR
jgi:hypothetical protein